MKVIDVLLEGWGNFKNKIWIFCWTVKFLRFTDKIYRDKTYRDPNLSGHNLSADKTYRDKTYQRTKPIGWTLRVPDRTLKSQSKALTSMYSNFRGGCLFRSDLVRKWYCRNKHSVCDGSLPVAARPWANMHSGRAAGWWGEPKSSCSLRSCRLRAAGGLPLSSILFAL